MRIGVLIVPTDPWPVALRRVQEVEQLGFDHLWTYDHLSWRRFRDQPWLGTVPWLAAMAAATASIRLGTMVTSPNFRHPVLLAKDIAAIDQISGGRFSLGLGAGGTGADATVMGQDPLTPKERVDRFNDFTFMLDGLLRQPTFSAETSWYSAVDARNLPGCLQKPRVPMVIAAGGKRTMSIVARFGQGWVTIGDPQDQHPTTAARTDAVQAQQRLLEVACEAAGRDVSKLSRYFLAGGSGVQRLDSISQFEALHRWALEMGFTDLIVHDPRPGDSHWPGEPRILAEIAAEYLVPRA